MGENFSFEYCPTNHKTNCTKNHRFGLSWFPFFISLYIFFFFSYPVNGPSTAIIPPIDNATMGGTAGPGMGNNGLVTINIIKTTNAVPKNSIKNA